MIYINYTMSILEHTEWWYRLYDTIDYGVAIDELGEWWGIASDAKIICASHIGDRVRYAQKLPTNYIDFPWEYEINWYIVECRVSQDTLSYQIKMPTWIVFGIVANQASFDVATFDASTTLYCTTQEVADEAAKQEIEAEIIVLSATIDQPENTESK